MLPEPERYVVPLAAYLALRSYASTQSDPTGQVEAAFLSLLIAGVLAAIAALGANRRGTPELAATAVLATMAVWIAYQGPSRGAVVSLILVLGLTVSAARALLDRQGDLRSGQDLDPGLTVPLALGLQLLMRGDLLLAPLSEVRTLASLLALPVVAGVAISVLASGLGRDRALLAGGLAAVLAPGWTLTSTLALAALAAGVLFNDDKRPKVLRWATVAFLALLPLWSLPKGLLFAVAAMAIATPSLTTASLVLVATVAVVLLNPQMHSLVVAIRWWVGAVLLVPAAALAAAPSPRTGARPEGLGQKAEPKASGFWGVAGPGGRWQLRLGVILTLAAAVVSKAPEAMAAGIAIAAFAAPTRGAAATLQRVWCAVVMIGTSLLAAYPWVREDPRGDLLALLGFSNEVSALLALLLVVFGVHFALDQWRAESFGGALDRRLGWLASPTLIACLLLGLAATRQVMSMSGTAVLVNSYGPIALTADNGSWQQSLPSGTVSAVALDSHLAGGMPLGPFTEVAVVELRADDDTVLAEWPLRVGHETGEWAASRPDLAGRIGFTAPAPWISWVAPGGGFFAHRFRAHLDVFPDDAKTVTASQIAIRRSDGLPAETRLSIDRLELRQ